MKWYSNYTHPDGLHFIILDRTPTGFYLYLYERTETFKLDLAPNTLCPHHQDDFDQDTLEIAQEQAFEDFGVPLDSWVKAE